MAWIISSWHELLRQPWADVALTIVAVLCGAIVGTERERKQKPAGLRTLVLVCVGSTVFTLASYAFGTTTGDTGRVAAQIVTGVGFLGTGVIMHGRAEVSGLTTAATIWATAAIGMVVGVGYASAGLSLSILIRGVLRGFDWWEQSYLARLPACRVELLLDLDHGKTRCRLERLLESFQLRKGWKTLSEEANGISRVRIEFKLPRRQSAEFLDELAKLPAVREIRHLD